MNLHVQQNAIICPFPLVYFNSTPQNTETYPATSNCATPCPSIDYNQDQWDSLSSILLYVSGIACVLSAAVFLAHIPQFKRYYIRIMFIGGFLVNSFVMFSFQIINRNNNSVVCDGAAHFKLHAPLCVFSAACQIWGLIWSHTWSVIMAFDTYLHVTLRHRAQDANKLRVLYGIVGFSIPTLFTALPLSYGILGFDHQANIPMCFYLVSNYRWVFWACFVGPFYVLLTVSLVFTFATARRIHEVFISSGHYQSDQHLVPKKKQLVDVPFLNSYRPGVLSELSPHSSEIVYVDQTEPMEIPVAKEKNPSSEILNDLVRRQQKQINASMSSLSGSNRGSELGPPLDDLGFVYMTPPESSMVRPVSDITTSPQRSHKSYTGSGDSACEDDVGELPDISNHSGNNDAAAILSKHQASSGTKLTRSFDQNSNSFSYSLQNSSTLRDSLLEEVDNHHTEYGDYADYEFYDTDDDHSAAHHSSKRVQRPNGYTKVNTAEPIIEASAGAGQEEYYSLSWLMGSSERRRRSSSNDGWSCLGMVQYLCKSSRDCLSLFISTISCGYCCSGLPQDISLLFSAIWHYNGRAILFVVVCGLTSFTLLALVLKLFYIEFNDYVDSAEEYAACLVNASLTCSDQTQAGVNACGANNCGHHPQNIPNLAILSSIMAWNAGYGIAPSLIFGFLGYAQPAIDAVAGLCMPGYASHPAARDVALN